MSYQQNYQTIERAQKYNSKYKQKLFKRWTTARELAILGKAFSLVPQAGVVLDLPCGGGRLYSAVRPHCRRILGMDYALGQVQHYRAAIQDPQARFAVGSGLQIPMADAAVNGVLCVRLMHHLPRPEDRAKLFRELMRVAGQFVIVTFFDTYSVKNWIRRLTKPFHGKRDKMTMSHREIRELARESGFHLVKSFPLAFFFSGHRYAVLQRAG